ncbi:MAG: nucleotidyltransferase domain-containing protein [Ktedonobacteraceae bacterium]
MAMTNSPPGRAELRQRYEGALAAFVARVRRDRTVLAAFLYGSLANDDVWEKSDIDILLVSKEDKVASRYYSLVEHEVNFSVFLSTRSRFKTLVERALQGSMMHSIMTKSTLLFSEDESIQECLQAAHSVGSRDREYQLLKAAASIIPTLTKAEKWLVVKQDPAYSFVLLMNALPGLARVEVLLHSGVTGREVIQQALEYNPVFFIPLYQDLINQPKSEAVARQALTSIHAYLDEHLFVLFKTLLDYLATAGGARSTTEINEYLRKKMQLEDDELEPLGGSYEWLAGKGIIQRVCTPVRLTEKSKITMNEAAYYYDADAMPEGVEDA